MNTQDKNDETALIFAARNGDYECIELLLQEGANMNRVGWRGSTALMWAVRPSNAECVCRLLQTGADINHCNQLGYNALKLCVKFLHSEEQKKLAMLLYAAGGRIQNTHV